MIEIKAVILVLFFLFLIALSLYKRLNVRIKALENFLSEAIKIEFYINNKKEKVENMFLKVSQNLPVSIAIKDIKGNVAKVDGLPVWAVTDESLAKLQVADDGMSAVIQPIGPVGLFKVQVSADADLGEGVKSILGELEIELIGGEAAVIELSAGLPIEQ